MRTKLVVGGLLVVLFLLSGAAIAVGGELSSFMLASLEALPFLLLAVLSQAGERRVWARVLTYIWLTLLVLGFAFLVVVLAASARMGEGGLGSPFPYVGDVFLVVVAAFALALPLLFRGVRKAIARLIPISPDSLVHKVALFFLVYLTLGSLGQLAALGGEPPLLSAIQTFDGSGTSRTDAGQLLDMLYGFFWIIPTALVAAGYPLRRYLAESIRRLGFTRPSQTQLLLGLALSVVLVGLFTALDQLIVWIWAQFGWPTTDVEAFRKLVGAGFSPLGAVVIGITAGVGEEAATRGLLQPRLGKLLPNLAFVAVHAFQYGPDALLSVFLMGLILAFVRSWSSTTIAALVHGTYDFLVIMMEVLEIGF